MVSKGAKSVRKGGLKRAFSRGEGLDLGGGCKKTGRGYWGEKGPENRGWRGEKTGRGKIIGRGGTRKCVPREGVVFVVAAGNKKMGGLREGETSWGREISGGEKKREDKSCVGERRSKVDSK